MKQVFNRVPLNGSFELTARCNLNCKMCMIRLSGNAAQKNTEISADEWIGMAEQVCREGTLGLLLTGGEPFLRDDFAYIYSKIAKMGFMLTVYTNATLMTQEIFEVLKRQPPHRIGVTVYGASADTYEKVCGDGDAYYRMLDGVNQIKQLPSKLSLRTTIIKDNLADYEKLSDFGHSFGNRVDFNVSRIVTMPVRGGVSRPDLCRLSPYESASLMSGRTHEMLKGLLRFCRDNPYIDQDIGCTPKTDHVGKRTLYGCNAGVDSYAISWDGRLFGCELLEDACTYPFKDGFKKAWEEFPDTVIIPPLPEKCRKCDIECTACYATRLAETKMLSGIPEYLCNESNIYNIMIKNIMSDLKEGKEREEKYDERVYTT